MYKDSVTLYHKRSGGSVVDNMLVIKFDPDFSGLSVLKTEVVVVVVVVVVVLLFNVHGKYLRSCRDGQLT